MTLSLTPTKRGVWLIRYGKYRETLYPTLNVLVSRIHGRNDVLLVNGMLIDSKKGRK